jgi:hypothetical protein
MDSVDYEAREATVFGPLIGPYRAEGPDEPRKGAFIVVSCSRCVIDGPFLLEGVSGRRVLVVAPIRDHPAREE